MMMKHPIRNLWIILLFSILHGLCCICCRKLEIEDTRALTLLTIAMVFVLSHLRGLKVYFIIATIIIVNVVAYLMGSALPMVLRPFLGNSIWIYVISTTLTTLILGIAFELSADIIFKVETNSNEEASKEKGNNKQFKKRWVVRINDRIVPVKTEEIAYFFSEDKCNYLVTFDVGKYIVDSTMDAIASELDPERFFRINRGCILAMDCIDSAVVNAGRYSVQAHPAIGVPMIVSRSRVADFLKWLS